MNNDIDGVSGRGGEPDTAMAGRPGRAVADRKVDTLCEQPAAAQRGRRREDRRLNPEMGIDQPGPGGRARRADRRSRQGRRRGEVGTDGTDPGDRRARLERGGKAGLSPGRQ